jgi:HK97 family phage portal protein
MLSRLFAKPEVRAAYPAGYDPIWGYWPGDQIATSSGANVTAASSLQLMAVYGCVRLITDGISTMPIDVYREKLDGSRVEITKPTWLTQPSRDLDFSAWCSQVLTSLLLHGNAYVAVLRNPNTTIIELVPLNPDMIQVRIVNGTLAYSINGQITQAEIMHVKGLMMPGSLTGVSPIEAARQSIGLGLSAQEYGARFFAGEGNMPGVIEAPRPMLPGKMAETASLWQRKRAKGGRGLPGVLDDGATWKPTGVTHEQMQFLGTRGFNAAEIAGQLFLVDPTDIGITLSGSTITYGNITERNARRLQVTFLPWMIRIENALSDLLASPRYMKFNADALLRSNLTERYAAYSTGIAAGFLTVDEPREWEDLPPMGTPAPVDVVDPAEQMNSAGIHDINVTVNLPEQRFDAPVVNVSTPDIRIEQPAVTVNVPEQPAPTVNVRNDAPIVNVSVPETRAKSQRIEHDAEGRIVKVVTE